MNGSTVRLAELAEEARAYLWLLSEKYPDAAYAAVLSAKLEEALKPTPAEIQSTATERPE